MSDSEWALVYLIEWAILTVILCGMMVYSAATHETHGAIISGLLAYASACVCGTLVYWWRRDKKAGRSETK